jgi:hypothetical protein
VPSQKNRGNKNCTWNQFVFQFCDANEVGINHKMILLDLEIKKHESIFFKHPFKISATYWNLGYNMRIFFFSNFGNSRKNTPFSSF